MDAPRDIPPHLQQFGRTPRAVTGHERGTRSNDWFSTQAWPTFDKGRIVNSATRLKRSTVLQITRD